MILLVLVLKTFKSIFVFIFMFLTDPHVSPARCVLANVSRLPSFSTIVVLIRTLENLFGIMAV